MKSLLETQLFRATALTFEELGFLLPGDLEDEARHTRADAVVEVAFRGPFGGRLVLAVAGGILRSVVSNMLGEESANSTACQQDALGELANVICGNVLPAVAGNHHTFNLAAPRILAGGVPTVPASSQVHVGIEGGRADVYLFLEGAEQKLGRKAA